MLNIWLMEILTNNLKGTQSFKSKYNYYFRSTSCQNYLLPKGRGSSLFAVVSAVIYCYFSLLLAHLHWLVVVATQEIPYFSEEPVAVATGGGYP